MSAKTNYKNFERAVICQPSRSQPEGVAVSVGRINPPSVTTSSNFQQRIAKSPTPSISPGSDGLSGTHGRNIKAAKGTRAPPLPSTSIRGFSKTKRTMESSQLTSARVDENANLTDFTRRRIRDSNPFLTDIFSS